MGSNPAPPRLLMTTDHSFLPIHMVMDDAALRTLPSGRAAPLQEWVNHSPVHWMKELVACDALCPAERMKYCMKGTLVVPFFKKVVVLQTTKRQVVSGQAIVKSACENLESRVWITRS